jgi:phosphatidate phosphatase PAH1
MRSLRLLVVVHLMACTLDMAGHTDDDDQVDDDDDDEVVPPPPGAACTTAPDAGPAGAWRHTTSSLYASLDPHHRGIDLVAAAEDALQTLGGRLTYGPTDKDLEDEDVDVFACASGAWRELGRATTDDEGRFAMTLSGAQRLPVGLHDLYLSVVGDRSGVPFVGLVAPSGTPVVVADVDGTLTESENAYPKWLAFGGDVDAHADAPAALAAAASRGALIVYVTARGDRFTQDTRDWFAAKGFPRGPLRMPTAIVTLPGDETIALKTNLLASLAAFELSAGVGNRASDIAAYTNAGLSPDRIFIKGPEFDDETSADIAAGKATRFTDYEALIPTL